MAQSEEQRIKANGDDREGQQAKANEPGGGKVKAKTQNLLY